VLFILHHFSENNDKLDDNFESLLQHESVAAGQESFHIAVINVFVLLISAETLAFCFDLESAEQGGR
jgi:hypothetical protein